jgi:FecR protein
MTHGKELPNALKALRNTPVVLPTEAELRREKDALLPWLETAVAALPGRILAEQRARRRTKLLRAGAALTTLAAGLAFAWLQGLPGQAMPGTDAQRSAHTPLTLPAAQGSATLLEGQLRTGDAKLLAGSRLAGLSVVDAPPDSSATLRGASGYRATLAATGRLGLGAPGANEELRLVRGQVALEVPKLRDGASLRVRTSDALVIVHGTRFTVVAADPASLGARTCVRVEEGVVEVQRNGAADAPSELLHQGQHSGCSVERARTETEQTATVESTRLPSPTGPKISKGGTLALETELLARGITAERDGDLARAQNSLKKLLESYPRSPLAREARIALSRIERAQSK